MVYNYRTQSLVFCYNHPVREKYTLRGGGADVFIYYADSVRSSFYQILARHQ
jgi:hypothetical protein